VHPGQYKKGATTLSGRYPRVGDRLLLLILICAATVLVQIERSQRWPRLDPWRRRWEPIERATVAYVRSTPFTYVYLAILILTTWIEQTSTPLIARALLLERSTNLHQLARDPVKVLVSSAFWLSSRFELLVWILLFTLVMAQVERWIGSLRTALVFAVGHIGATLITAVGLWFAVRYSVESERVVHAVDVGASYGFFAVAAVLAYRLRGRWLALYLAVAIGSLGIIAAVNHGFADFGHLTALALGFALGPFVTRRARSADPASSSHPAA
jgi:membrane associated rhomboid family serine protease